MQLKSTHRAVLTRAKHNLNRLNLSKMMIGISMVWNDMLSDLKPEQSEAVHDLADLELKAWLTE